MNFIQKQKDIINFIKNNLNNYLVNLPQLSDKDFINDFLDFDKYRQSNCIFFDFQNYTFDELSSDNRAEQVTMHVYIKCTGTKRDTLKERLGMYASAIYNFFYDDGSCLEIVDDAEIVPCNRNFHGLVDNGIIQTVTFYDAADGSPDIKVCDLTFLIDMED